MSSEQFPRYDAREHLKKLLAEFPDTKYLMWIIDWSEEGCKEAIRDCEAEVIRHENFGRKEDAKRARVKLEKLEQLRLCWPLISAIRGMMMDIATGELENG